MLAVSSTTRRGGSNPGSYRERSTFNSSPSVCTLLFTAPGGGQCKWTTGAIHLSHRTLLRTHPSVITARAEWRGQQLGPVGRVDLDVYHMHRGLCGNGRTPN